ncbi:sucrose-6-phosphate hydrolase [Bacillus sp. MUM 13]|uniref:glycoside hydrolase family 32 protein n=1 Tax=Bacillus sp. MUM 13 TaxID=1678001 RepID=UPI000A9B6F48|nr:sucrose-6-phosphate hydrolase [Bacillus sp. MUM 13]
MADEKNYAIEAEKHVLENAEKGINSPYKMAYHIVPPASWMNDPNGLIYWEGYYHVFFQFHPYDVKTGWMHWGHVRSRDLVHWERLPIALYPLDEYDRDGCFSGSAVDDNGVLTLVYTGNIFIDKELDDVDECQCIATSADGIHFEKDLSNPVIKKHPENGSGHFRDPKVWKKDGFWYMAVGTRKDYTGKILLYRSECLRNWDYIGVMAESDEEKGYMWECPDFFELEGKHILLASPQGMEARGDSYQNLYQSVYMIGELDYKSGKYSYHTFEELDGGFDFYAPQTFMDHKGRRLMFAWMDMWESKMPSQKYGTAGSLTIPRELVIRENRLVMKPAEDLKLLRGKKAEIPAFLSKGEHLIPDINGDTLEICISFDLASSDASEFGLKVRCSEDGREETAVSYSQKDGYLTFNRNKSGEGDGGVRRVKLQMRDAAALTLHLFLDRSSLEIFANDGEAVMSGRIYPNQESRNIKVFSANGTVSVASFECWNLKDIWA